MAYLKGKENYLYVFIFNIFIYSTLLRNKNAGNNEFF